MLGIISMLYQKITSIILLFSIFILVADFSSAEPIDSGTYWLLVDATTNARTKGLLNTLTGQLVGKGKVSKNNIRRIEGEDATNEKIHAALKEIGTKTTTIETVAKIETVVFLFHGEVLKPSNSNSMHFTTQSEESIQDSTLNRWFKETLADKVLVIIDGYANEDNLGIYYANREIIGSSALNVIHPAATAKPIGNQSFLQAFIDALATDETDADDNRQISIIEISQDIQDNRSFGRSIFAPTGDVDDTVMKLSPAIKVLTFPEGAQIMLNETESGLTPKLFTEGLLAGSYTVSVSKAGFNRTESKTAELALKQGEVVNIAWVLTPISIYGTVTTLTGENVFGTSVSIEGTEYTAQVNEDGTYTFADWNIDSFLTPSHEYLLYAKKGDFYHGSAVFTYDGFESIDQPIKLNRMTWFEIAEFEFARNNHQQAVNAFQKGIGDATDFPALSEDLTTLLLSTFADAIDRAQVQDVKYIVVTAKLADSYQQPEVAKQYWQLAKLNAQKGSPEAKMAGQRLWQLNPWRNYVNIGIVVLVIVILISGVWTFYRFLQSRKVETDT